MLSLNEVTTWDTEIQLHELWQLLFRYSAAGLHGYLNATFVLKDQMRQFGDIMKTESCLMQSDNLFPLSEITCIIYKILDVLRIVQ